MFARVIALIECVSYTIKALRYFWELNEEEVDVA
jgi:hypothetical protein